MKILLVGGSGLVGTCVTPYLLRHHELRVFDLVSPKHEGVEFVAGSITDPEALRTALDGVDTFITMVMKSGQGGSSREHTVQQTIDNYQVNCLGLHLLLYIAQELGIANGVHTSTMSVHHRGTRERYRSEDEVPLDGPNVYGLSKGFGERICHYFAREYDFNLAVFRITGPRPPRALYRGPKEPARHRRRHHPRHRRGGSGPRLPSRGRLRPDRPRPLRHLLHLRRRHPPVDQYVQGQSRAALGAPDPGQAGDLIGAAYGARRQESGARPHHPMEEDVGARGAVPEGDARTQGDGEVDVGARRTVPEVRSQNPNLTTPRKRGRSALPQAIGKVKER